MTKEEAYAYLGEEWEEGFEEQIFTLKQQLLTLVPIHKLYEAKLSKWKKLEEAFIHLGGQFQQVDLSQLKLETPIFSDNISDAFKTYQEYRNRLKISLLNSVDSETVIVVLDSFIKLEVSYAALWHSEDFDDNIIISNVPDPMEILKAIKCFENLGGKTFKDLIEMANVAPETLKREQKRLTLYHNKYGENG
jgi:hypothetical protein